MSGDHDERVAKAVMTPKLAREIAARVWCDHEMSHRVMDTDAAEKIAAILMEYHGGD